MAGVVASSPDPFICADGATGDTGNRDINGKTVFTGSTSGMLVLVVLGQSNVCNVTPSAYTPTNTTVYNLNLYDGALYKAIDPLLGCSTVPSTPGNPMSRLGDKLINAGASGVILVPIAIGGATVAQWADTSPTGLGTRTIAALARLSARNITPTAILWGQGESDKTLGTSQAAYAASLTTVIGISRTAGFAGPWFISQQTWNGGSVSTAIEAAQTGIVNHSSNIWAGPNADSLDATNRQADNTHWNDTGADAYAGLWQTALHAFGAPF